MWKDSKIPSRIITWKVSNLLSFTPYNTQMRYQKNWKASFFFPFLSGKEGIHQHKSSKSRWEHSTVSFSYIWQKERYSMRKIIHAVRVTYETESNLECWISDPQKPSKIVPLKNNPFYSACFLNTEPPKIFSESKRPGKEGRRPPSYGLSTPDSISKGW